MIPDKIIVKLWYWNDKKQCSLCEDFLRSRLNSPGARLDGHVSYFKIHTEDMNERCYDDKIGEPNYRKSWMFGVEIFTTQAELLNTQINRLSSKIEVVRQEEKLLIETRNKMSNELVQAYEIV